MAPPLNVAAHLPALSTDRPHALAVVCPAGRVGGRVAYTHLTFRQLDADSDRVARGLRRLGVAAGTRVALMVPPGLEFFALTFALFKLGTVPVLIDPGMGVRGLGRCLGEARPELFVGVRKAQAGRLLFGWARPTVKLAVGVGTRLGCRHTLNDVRSLGDSGGSLLHDAGRDETAAVLFTSGSTGPAKGVVYTHGMFSSQVEALRGLYGIEAGEVDLATFPLFALFGPALGMTAVVPDMDPTRPARVDPRKIFEAVADWGVTNLFGSPALLDRVGRFGVAHGPRFPDSLRRVVSAGAPVPAVVLERLTTLLPPGVQAWTPYGATECLPVASIGSDEILGGTRFATDGGAGVCVGRPVPGVEVAIIPVDAAAIPRWAEVSPRPAGEVGEICVRAPWASRRYDRRPEATASAKIDDADGGFWHRMGDLGSLDAAGRLWFRGRKAHRVRAADGDMDTIPVEAVFNTHPAVYRSALVGVSRNGRVEPVLCVELEGGGRGVDRARVTRELLILGAKFDAARAVGRILYHPAFPVDVRHNAKIFREKLAEWASRQP